MRCLGGGRLTVTEDFGYRSYCRWHCLQRTMPLVNTPPTGPRSRLLFEFHDFSNSPTTRTRHADYIPWQTEQYLDRNRTP
jgi:hypothetical protein